MAARQGLRPNKLNQALSVRALAEHDTDMRFRMRAARGEPVHELRLFDQPDHWHAEADDPDAE